MERPFAGVPTDLVIWEVGNERVFPLRKLQEGCRFRQIVSNCWRADPERRPTFEDLLLTLENNVSWKRGREKERERERIREDGFEIELLDIASLS